jgi:hypothetical protein
LYHRYDMTMTDPEIAFVTETYDPPAVEIRVNFGVFAGRAATQAEIDDLAKELLPELREVTIVGEDRHEISEDVEASLHQVRIEVDGEHLPADGDERDQTIERLLAAAERWAETCIADRHAEVTEI